MDEPNQPFREEDDADAAFFAIIRLSKLLATARSRQSRVHPTLDGAAYPLLFAASTRPMRISDLAEHVHSDVSTVSRQVANLVKHGLVERRPDPTDGRAQTIQVTEGGREVVAALRANRSRFANSLVADWDPQDVATLRRLLERLHADFDEHLAGRREDDS